MSTQTYTVTGMTCGHCVASITEEVQEIGGVQDVAVDLATGALTITSQPVRRRCRREGRRRGGRLPAHLSPAARIVAFLGALAASFAVALGIGKVVDPVVTSEPPQHSEPGRHEVALEITGPDGHAVTAYDVEREKQLHLIVVRRDFTGFQHVHPVLVALREGDLAYLHVHPEVRAWPGLHCGRPEPGWLPALPGLQARRHRPHSRVSTDRGR